MTKKTKLYFLVIFFITALCLLAGIVTRYSYTGYREFDKMEKAEKLAEYSVQISEDRESEIFSTSIKNYNDLEKTADLIIKVSATNERKLFLHTSTKTKVIVDEVIKGNIKAGQEIYIYEPANFSYSISKSYQSLGGYQIMKQGEKYYLFLQKLKTAEGYKMSDKEKHTYLPTTAAFSKYPLKEGDLKTVDEKKLYNDGYKYGEIENLEIITSEQKILLKYKKMRGQVFKYSEDMK